MYIPTSKEEVSRLNWIDLDVIFITGDAYIDSSYMGIAILGKYLIKKGFRVGIIAQPDIDSQKDILRLGEPKLFWGVTSGSVDSMVANYTASKKWRKQDDYTPGSVNNKRPDRAVIKYVNLIKRYSKKIIAIGGVEASLRRIAHYDYWSNKIRSSILFNSKADILVYGMAERSILEIANKLKNNLPLDNIRGTCTKSNSIPDDYTEIPSIEDVKKDKKKFIEMFHVFYQNNDPLASVGLAQKHDTRYLLQHPPAHYLDQNELDEVYSLDYENELHPYYRKDGKVKAIETIGSSITTHRGCYGACTFCAIAVHQGRTVRSRSQDNIVKEAKVMSEQKHFKGYIKDVGGATANMYGYECKKKLKLGSCKDRECIYPDICPALKITHKPQLELLSKLREIKNIKKIFITSGLRYDMILHDKNYGKKYIRNLSEHHVSGQLKIAPEHISDNVLECMGKPSNNHLLEFKKEFDDVNRRLKKKQFLTYYLIAAHPGSENKDMYELKTFTQKGLKMNPEQVQIFTPTPSTYATLMYYTELDPFTLKPIFVEKDMRKKVKQKEIIINSNDNNKKRFNNEGEKAHNNKKNNKNNKKNKKVNKKR